jgi:pSer/pThr/pTyr-binding forkhead associated (FHA) protein/ribosomal protein L37AE/L43A
VSRHHLDVILDANKIFIVDKSSNGTFVNGSRIAKDVRVPIKPSDQILLSNSYLLDINRVLARDNTDPNATRIFNPPNSTSSSGQVEMNLGDKTVVFDADKTQIGEILSMDNSAFVTIGRSSECDYTIEKGSISKKHCRVRLIDPRLIEIEDLGSTNGTFADGVRLSPSERLRYTSGVQLTLGADTPLDLTKVLRGIQIVRPNSKQPDSAGSMNGGPITQEEKKSFDELEAVWREYQERQSNIGSAGSGIAMGGMAASSLVAAVAGGPIGIIIGVGGSLMARYLSQQKVSKLRNDFSYEDMFLQVYACPRCKESFQKKPWITIRECLKCRTKFRS